MENNPVKRRLMAILAADAVGYSRMMGEDEVRTIRVLAGHREAIDALIANYGAKIIGTAGDSVLAEFGSAVDAVRCATEIQDAVRERNEKLPEHDRMWFRIGVNLGDVIVSEAEVHGDGVNVAVRLESIAEPGGVCISSSVYDQISGKLNLGFTDIGEQNLKNIARPIRAYRFAGPVPPILPRPMKAQPRRGGARPWAWGAAALAIVALAAAWQAGMLPSAKREAEAAKAQAARAQQEQRADDERARMEAELARARSEAETAKKQAEAQSAAAADARRSLETQRAAEAKARAQAELAQARAEAEAIKRDAQAQAFAATRAREQAEASAAQAKALEETAAKAAAEAQARQATAEKARQEAAAKAAAKTPVIASAAPSMASRYDGVWMATESCEATRRSPQSKIRLPARISEGNVQIRDGRPGENGYFSLEGRIASDGGLALSGVQIPKRAEFGREERPVHFEGKLEGDRFLLKGEVRRRPCTLELTRFTG